MTTLFDRRCKVLVGPPPKVKVYTLQTIRRLEISDHRMSFKIIKDKEPSPNNVEILIYNLAEPSRKAFEEKGARIILLAGYSEQTSQIASADITTCNSQKIGPDWVTKIEAADGDRSFKHARVKESYTPGTPISAVLTKTLQALGLDPGTSLARVGQIAGQFSSGYVQNTRASTELTKLLKSHDHEWSIQDGRVEVLKKGEALAELAPIISPDTGLIGSPELGTPTKKDKKGVLKVRSLLQPRIRPGQKFQLKTRAHDATYVAKKVTHIGDTFGNDWYTDIEADP